MHATTVGHATHATHATTATPISLATTDDVPAERRAFLDTLVDLRLGPSLDVELADDPVEQLDEFQYRIAMLRAQLSAGDVPVADRAAAIEALMELHLARLVAAGDHPRRPGWALDRAEDAWRWQWTHEATGVQLLIGVPDRRTRRWGEDAARAMVDATADAARRFDGVLAAMEASPAWPDDAALQREHRETVADRDGRLVLLQALAAAMHALGLTGEAPSGFDSDAAAISPGRSRAAPDADSAAGPRADPGADSGADSGAGLGAGPAAGPLAARITAAETQLRRVEADLEARMADRAGDAGQPVASAGIDPLGATLAQLRWMRGHLRAMDADPARARRAFASAVTAAEAAGDPFTAEVSRIASAMVRVAEDSGAAASDFERLFAATEDPAMRLLAGDACFRGFAARARRLNAAAGRASGASANAAETEANAAWRSAGAGWRASIAGMPGGESLVIERWARGLRPGDPVASMPVVARLGAERSARAVGDAATADRWLESVAVDATADAAVASAAAERRAARARERGDRDGVRRWTRLAAERSVDPAFRAASVDAMLRAALDAATAADWGEPAASAFQRAVDEIRTLAPEMAAADRWRSIAATQAFREGRPERATALLDEIDPDGASGANAAALRCTMARQALTAALEPGVADAAPVAELARALVVAVTAARARPDAETAGGPIDRVLGDGRAIVWMAQAHLLAGDLERAWDELTRAESEAMDAAARTAHAALRLDLLDRMLAGAAEDPRQRERGAAAVTELLASGDPAAQQAVVDRLRRAVDQALDDPRPLDAVERARGIDRRLAPLRDPLAAALDSNASANASANAPANAPAEPAPAGPADRPRDASVAIADAYRLAGDHAAARPWYDSLGGASSADPRVLFGVAEAARAAATEASFAEAMTIYRRLGSDRPGAGEHRWWVSQLRMLQILDWMQRRGESIGPRIERLRRAEPDLGGPAVAAGFAPLIERYVDRP
ncbi:MAG: hypothetical protein AB8G96_14430 [Phycisphaerales bacterium]